MRVVLWTLVNVNLLGANADAASPADVAFSSRKFGPFSSNIATVAIPAPPRNKREGWHSIHATPSCVAVTADRRSSLVNRGKVCFSMR